MIPVTLMAKNITVSPLCPTGMWSACTTWHPATKARTFILYISTVDQTSTFCILIIFMGIV